ncbi:MAG: ribosome small subunit-dependent GTPase A [Bacteroidales bacterium]|nr:ribosome small subunit-dependent GTPase A [Bacteroidales bacterium]
MEGLVIKSTGSWYLVLQNDGTKTECKLKGNFRNKGIKTTNPVAVGDKVDFKYLQDKRFGFITKIFDRHNYIIRRATNLSKISHIIAANIDQVLLVVSLAKPRTSTGFIDRFLVTAEAYHIPAIIIFNKLDIYDNKLQFKHDEIISIYEKAGYKCLGVSVFKNYNLEKLRELLKNKINLFAGHSGVGKSALINMLEPGLNLKTKEISKYHEKGRHATTFTEMYQFSFGGFIIDTPGVKEFGLLDFKNIEISERFPEMRKIMMNCRFNNCTHIHEPDCAVLEALKNGEISQSRYNNYLSIFNDEYFDEKEWD